MLKDFIISLGLESIKIKVTDNADRSKIEKLLREYLEREKVRFEFCTMHF